MSIQDSIDSVNNNIMKRSDIPFFIGDYIKTETCFGSECFGKILEKNGDTYECLVSEAGEPFFTKRSVKFESSKQSIRSDDMTRITEKEYQEGILTLKKNVAHYRKLNKYCQASKYNIVLLRDILKKDYPDIDSFKNYFKEIVSIHFNEIFSLETLSPIQKQDILEKFYNSKRIIHEESPLLSILTQQYILSTISKQLKTDEFLIIKDICTEKQNNQIEFCQRINDGLKKPHYTYEEGFILVILGIIIILMIPAFAPHFRIGSFIFGPLSIVRGLYILIKLTRIKKSR